MCSLNPAKLVGGPYVAPRGGPAIENISIVFQCVKIVNGITVTVRNRALFRSRKK
jgi:hypothetical protein